MQQLGEKRSTSAAIYFFFQRGSKCAPGIKISTTPVSANTLFADLVLDAICNSVEENSKSGVFLPFWYDSDSNKKKIG